MAEMRARVPYLLGLPGEPASACASSPAAPLTLNYLVAVTTNQSNYRSRIGAAAPIAPLVALALKCMRSTFYHCYLFNAALSPASHLTSTAKLNH